MEGGLPTKLVADCTPSHHRCGPNILCVIHITVGLFLQSCTGSTEHKYSIESCNNISYVYQYLREHHSEMISNSYYIPFINSSLYFFNKCMQISNYNADLRAIEASPMDGVTNSEDIASQATRLSKTAPPEFKNATFFCISDFEMCNQYYITLNKTGWAYPMCGIAFVSCMGKELMPSITIGGKKK